MHNVSLTSIRRRKPTLDTVQAANERTIIFLSPLRKRTEIHPEQEGL